MRIADILRGKGADVVTISPDATVSELLALLAEYKIGAVVVSASGTAVDGIVSERDIVRALAARGPDILSEKVEEICTRAVTVAAPSDHLEQLMLAMTQGRFRHIPIVVDGALQGIVSIGDVVKARIGELEFEQQALTGYITSPR
jgi:CBS domain-containing protein